jgi:ribonuclease-3
VRKRSGPGPPALAAALGHRFRDPALLEAALTHRSWAHEREGPASTAHYERLEFLGDALLGAFVAESLYHDDPTAPEGVLSRRRQAVVRSSALADAARQLGLGEAIRLGRGEERTGGRTKPSLLADVFEALLGAVYLDGGVRAARAFVRRHLGEALRRTAEPGAAAEDPKTLLQERLQAELQRTPRYRIVSTTGPDHALEFTAEVLLGDCSLGAGRGSNRKRAEQEAARRALERLGRGRRS